MKATRLFSLLIATCALAVLMQAAAALAAPSLELTITPPHVSLEPSTTTTMTAMMTNDGVAGLESDSLHYVTLAAVLSNGLLMEFVQPVASNVRIVDSAGAEQWSGLVLGAPARFRYDDFSGQCDAFVFRLPSEAVLRGGDSVIVQIRVHCLGEGDLVLHVFPLATEDHHATPPELLSGVVDKTNIYYMPGSKKTKAGWYPLHHALDPQDVGRPSGHVFAQQAWTPRETEHAYAKADAHIQQSFQTVKTYGSWESDCFSEQRLAIPLTVDFTVGHKLKVAVDDVSVLLGSKLLPGEPGSGGTFKLRVWSNDDVEAMMTSSDFTGDDRGVNDEGATEATYPMGVRSDWGDEAQYDLDEGYAFTIPAERLLISVDGSPYVQGTWATIHSGPTDDAGAECDVNLSLSPSYADHAGYYTGSLLLQVRQF